MKAVARAGDAAATASGRTNYPNDKAPTATGAWAAVGPVAETPVTVAGADGKRVIRSASCTFTFTGTLTSNGNAFTSPPSVVTLSPGTRTLKVGGSDPLVDGDETSDSFGNTVSVTSTASWRTS
ncbi:hypothetical protein [Micromonospora sp. NPDC049679]|uniref:hypothetical protein n=1 Tax=Micromonospora sp. NPDC049679 TaxID=3155920 RepID=UPI0033CD29FB